MPVILVPVITAKDGKAGSIDTYMPIAIASVLSKVLKKILSDHISPFIFNTDSQFGFKADHSTDLCLYVLKEVVELYRSQTPLCELVLSGL